MRLAALLGVAFVVGCASRNTSPSAQWLFDSPQAGSAATKVPDLFAEAKEAALESDRAVLQGDVVAAADRRTQSRLLLTAAIVEAERLDLDAQRLDLAAQEEAAHRQLAAHQAARVELANEIARDKAAAIALREAIAAHELAERRERGARQRQRRSDLVKARDVLISGVRLDLAAAEALGAPADRLAPLWRRADTLASTRNIRLSEIERLNGEVYSLLGELRASAQPSFAMTASLMRAAEARGFTADRLQRGVVVTADSLFATSGRVNGFRARRLSELMQAFPHGPVQCSVLTDQSAVWKRRANSLRNYLRKSGVSPSRLSVESIPADAKTPPPTRCTFIAYGLAQPPGGTP